MTDSHRIALITDSTSDMRDVAGEHDIMVVPQIVIFGTESLRDGIDLQPETFYKRLEEGNIHPTTSQPTGADFVEFYKEAQSRGADEILVITLSDELSGTYDSAMQARELFTDIPVTVEDSRSVSWGCGFQVMAAHRVREAGGSVEEMLAAARKVREVGIVYFSLETLEYLHKGGRIGGAAKLVGTALNLKPLLKVDHSTGRIEPAERIRTRRKAIERTYEVFLEHMAQGGEKHVTVMHGAEPDLAEEFRKRITEDLAPKELYVTQVAPVIGVHTGPGAIALAGYYDEA